MTFKTTSNNTSLFRITRRKTRNQCKCSCRQFSVHRVQILKPPPLSRPSAPNSTPSPLKPPTTTKLLTCFIRTIRKRKTIIGRTRECTPRRRTQTLVLTRRFHSRCWRQTRMTRECRVFRREPKTTNPATTPGRSPTRNLFQGTSNRLTSTFLSTRA